MLSIGLAFALALAACPTEGSGGDAEYTEGDHPTSGSLVGRWEWWGSLGYLGAYEFVDATTYKKWTSSDFPGLDTPYYSGTYTKSDTTITFTPTSTYSSAETLKYKVEGDTLKLWKNTGEDEDDADPYVWATAPHALPLDFEVKQRGGSSSLDTTGFAILFQHDVGDLTANEVTFEKRTGDDLANALALPEKGAVTKTNARVYTLAVTPAGMGYLRLKLNKANVTSSTKTTHVYNPTASTITYGVKPDTYSNSSTTTKLTISLFKGMTGLTTDDITITNGTGSATKGSTLTDKYPSLGYADWELPITTVAAGTITVKITKSGIDSAEHTVTVYKK
ncbi:MAG: hypothetical protein MdMp014T_0332 [Treponematales bacterium]